MVAIKETFAFLGHHPTQPKLAVNKRKISNILTIAEPAPFVLIVRPCVLIPQDVKSIKNRFGSSEKQVAELWLAISIKAHDFTVENTGLPFRSRASPSHSREKLLNVFPLRETSRTPPPSEWSSERKPSHLSSKSQSGWQNGARARDSGNGCNCGRGTK